MQRKMIKQTLRLKIEKATHNKSVSCLHIGKIYPFPILCRELHITLKADVVPD